MLTAHFCHLGASARVHDDSATLKLVARLGDGQSVRLDGAPPRCHDAVLDVAALDLGGPAHHGEDQLGRGARAVEAVVGDGGDLDPGAL